ncbi:MAG: glycosyltransferase [Oscillospiraceae bacterium]
MDKLPEISIVVPIYKVEAYLDRCVQSIQNQTFTDLEIILVDDGSPDKCGDICDEYAKQDSRIKVLHKANGGLSSARNAGIEYATANYIMFLDSDDWMDLDTVEVLYKVLKQHDADIAECSFRNVYSDTIVEETTCTGAIIEGTNIDALEGILDWNHFKPVAWNKLYKREVIGDIRYPKGLLHEDEFTTYKYFWNAKKLVYVDVSKINYDCSRTESITKSGFNINKLDACIALYQRIEFFADNNIIELEEKNCNVFCWVTLENLYKCYQANLKGEKLDRVIETVKKVLPYLVKNGFSPQYLYELNMIANGGLKKFGKYKDMA